MSDGWRDAPGRNERGSQGGALVFGLLLVAIGAAFLVSDQLHFNWDRFGWPMFVIAPGFFLLLIGLAIPHEGGLGAAIPGGIITTTGLILAAQEATHSYETWAYAWALIAPGSVGATLAAHGLLHRRADLLDSGLRTAAVGLGLFVGFGLFFEYIIGLNDGSDSVFRSALPVLAIGLGVVIVILNLMPRRTSRADASDWRTPPVPPVPPAPPLA